MIFTDVLLFVNYKKQQLTVVLTSILTTNLIFLNELNGSFCISSISKFIIVVVVVYIKNPVKSVYLQAFKQTKTKQENVQPMHNAKLPILTKKVFMRSILTINTQKCIDLLRKRVSTFHNSILTI